jgi:hypothetical protein
MLKCRHLVSTVNTKNLETQLNQLFEELSAKNIQPKDIKVKFHVTNSDAREQSWDETLVIWTEYKE